MYSSKPAAVLGIAVFMLWNCSVWAAPDKGPAIGEEALSRAVHEYGPAARHHLLDWQVLIGSFRDAAIQKKLVRVNSFVNSLRYVEDQRHWGREEYWATPLQTVASGGGDCEDLAIAKYFTLKAMGVSVEKIRLTYVKIPRRGQSHMVLIYSPDHAEPVVLDNLTDTIKPVSKRSDLLPVYSFNDTGLWVSRKLGQGRRVGGVEQLSRWRDLGTRLKGEPLGF